MINVCQYINYLPGEVLHIVFDVYSVEIDRSFPSKGREKEGQYRFISNLSQNL